MIRILLVVFLSMNLYADRKLFISCYESKSQIINLETDKVGKAEKENLKTKIYYDTIDEKYYFSEYDNEPLIFIGKGLGIFQFIETTLFGNKFLYTYHIEKDIMTIQKSYDINGSFITNIWLKCRLNNVMDR